MVHYVASQDEHSQRSALRRWSTVSASKIAGLVFGIWRRRRYAKPWIKLPVHAEAETYRRIGVHEWI